MCVAENTRIVVRWTDLRPAPLLRLFIASPIIAVYYLGSGAGGHTDAKRFSPCVAEFTRAIAGVVSSLTHHF